MDSLEILKQLISRASITPDDAGCLDFIRSCLPSWEAKWVNFDGDENHYGVKNLWLYKKFSDGVHVAFAGHVDVVPAGDGWDSDPFVPIQKDGYIYGRGTQDMKSGVAAFVSACMDFERAINDGKASFKGAISLILTSDEEGDGTHGTLLILQKMKELDLLPDCAIVAEPTCEREFGDSIKVGRRGSVNGKLSIIGRQGHAAYPEKCANPAHALAGLFNQLAGVDLDSGSEFFAPSKLVITDIRGGMQVSNVTPQRIDIMFNVRNSNLTSKEKIENYIKSVMAKLPDEFKYELSLKQGSYPFLTNKDSKVVKALVKSVKKITNIEPLLNTKGGTSDARYLSAFGIDSVELGVVNDCIHAINERVGLNELNGLYEVFFDFLISFDN